VLPLSAPATAVRACASGERIAVAARRVVSVWSIGDTMRRPVRVYELSAGFAVSRLALCDAYLAYGSPELMRCVRVKIAWSDPCSNKSSVGSAAAGLGDLDDAEDALDSALALARDRRRGRGSHAPTSGHDSDRDSDVDGCCDDAAEAPGGGDLELDSFFLDVEFDAAGQPVLPECAGLVATQAAPRDPAIGMTHSHSSHMSGRLRGGDARNNDDAFPVAVYGPFTDVDRGARANAAQGFRLVSVTLRLLRTYSRDAPLHSLQLVPDNLARYCDG
jgi:hypothetical protein